MFGKFKKKDKDKKSKKDKKDKKSKISKSGSFNDELKKNNKKYKDKIVKINNPKSYDNNRSKKKKKKKITSSISSSKSKNHYIIYKKNDYVLLTDKRKGKIRYIGTVHFGDGKWYGIELTDGNIGNHDGKVANKRYFKTSSNKAVFVNYDQITKLIKRKSNTKPSRDQYGTIPSNSNRTYNHSNSKKKKKKKEQASSSLKKNSNNRSKKKKKIKNKPKKVRPNSARVYDKTFDNQFDNYYVQQQQKQQQQFVSNNQPPPQHNKNNNNNNPDMRNSYSSHSSKSSHKSHRSNKSTRSSVSPRNEIKDHTSMESIYSPQLGTRIPIDIPTYKLKVSNSSLLSSDLASPDNNIIMNKPKIKKTNKLNASYTQLKSGKEYKPNGLNIRKNRSLNDKNKVDNDDYYTNLNLNDPAVQQLKYLQSSIKRRKNKSDDLEKILDAQSPPSLPQSPNNKLDIINDDNAPNNKSKYHHHVYHNKTVIIHDYSDGDIDDYKFTLNKSKPSIDIDKHLNAAFVFPPPSQFFQLTQNTSKSTPSTPTPKPKPKQYIINNNNNNNSIRNPSNNKNGHGPTSRFQFGRHRSHSDSMKYDIENIKYPPLSPNNNKKKPYRKRTNNKQAQLTVPSNSNDNNIPAALQSSDEEDTDIEDMYKEYPAQTTAGGVNNNMDTDDDDDDDNNIITDNGATIGGVYQQNSDNLDDFKEQIKPQKSSKASYINGISRPRSIEFTNHNNNNNNNDQNQQINHKIPQDNNEVEMYIQQHFYKNKAKNLKKKKNKNKYKNNKKFQEPVIEKWIKDETVVNDMDPNGITPRAMGTDAFSRIRSRSMQKKTLAAQQQKYYKQNNVMQSSYPIAGVGSIKENQEMIDKQQQIRDRGQSIKCAKDVCPFWNPFDELPTCPYMALKVGYNDDNINTCCLKHLSKSEYLYRLNEDDTIDLLSSLYADGYFIESCVVIEKLLKINKLNDEYNTCYADILEELGRYSDAEKYYRKALKINPMYDDAHNNYAMMLHHKLNKEDQAEIEYRKCLKISPNHQVCHTNYAKLLQSNLRYKEAEIHFKKCLALNEDNVNCQHYYGVFLYELGRWTESRHHLKKAIDLNPNNPSYHYNFAKLLCDLKEYSDADKQFKICLKLEDDNALFNFEYALFLSFDLKDTVKSIKYYVKSYILDPHNVKISKKYHEIAKIIDDNGGLTKIKRRKSSARLGASRRGSGGNRNKKITIIEYKDDNNNNKNKNKLKNGSVVVPTPCQLEFRRFLTSNFSFGSSMNVYLNKFIKKELNDIRYIVAIDIDTLLKDISMQKIHAKIMISKIDKFKNENARFIEWMANIALKEYYSSFEQNGILTFESFYFHIQNKNNLIKILGDRNSFDVDILWKSCPKFVRHHSNSNSNDMDNIDGNRPQTGNNNNNNNNDNNNNNNGVSSAASSLQVEGKGAFHKI